MSTPLQLASHSHKQWRTIWPRLRPLASDRVRAQRRQAELRIYTLARPALPFLGLHFLLTTLSTFLIMPPLLNFFMPMLRNLISKFNAADSSDDVEWQAWQVWA